LTEDTQHRAFPGIYNTVLGVEDISDVIDALRHVSSPPDAELMRVYSSDNAKSKRIPALIQTIISPRAGGVLFTNNPISLSESILINACWGLGKPVVDGTVDPDQFEVDRTGKVLSTLIAKKVFSIDMFGKSSWLPPGKSTEPCLSSQEIDALIKIAIDVEQLMRTPQDVEWMQDEQGKFWLVQTRPITTL
jgi:pyruvate,water dikinase